MRDMEEEVDKAPGMYGFVGNCVGKELKKVIHCLFDTSISFHKKLGLRLVHNNCDCRLFYPKTVIYIFRISQFNVTAQSEPELYM